MAFSCGSHNDDVILLFSGLWLNPATFHPNICETNNYCLSHFTEYLLYIGAILLAEKLKGSARKQYKLSIVVETLLPLSFLLVNVVWANWHAGHHCFNCTLLRRRRREGDTSIKQCFNILTPIEGCCQHLLRGEQYMMI